MDKSELHPCFNKAVKKRYARLHLPVAPECNIQCGYCNRKYDCVNESRPGVTSAILSPEQALKYVEKAVSKEPRITTIGIAGPGDAFAESERVLKTLSMIHNAYPELIFCVSTNGLAISPYIDELVACGVTHVTVTVNAIDPAIGAKIYRWVRYKKRIYRGEEGANVLLEQQMAAIKGLKKAGIIVKVNSIVIPGINDQHIPAIAEAVAELGVDIFNSIPMVPTEGSDFADLPEPSATDLAALNLKTGKFLPLMTHCQRCRADAVGLLGEDDHHCRQELDRIANEPTFSRAEKPYVAVASHEGILVNRHLGEADFLLVFRQDGSLYVSFDKREAPPAGSGDLRWHMLADVLDDCRAVLVNGIGDKPLKILKRKGFKVVEMTGLIENGLNHVFKNTPLRSLNKRSEFKCGSKCSGMGLGCG